jgi:acyl-coenzyme A thioesterase PaaI-like protein
MTSEHQFSRPVEGGVKQPNSNDCFACGLRNKAGLALSFYTTGPDTVQVEVTVPEQYQGYPGVVHGGIVATMLDEVVGRALMAGEETNFWQTGRLTVRYRQNVPIGEPLTITGEVTRRRGRIAESHAELRLGDGTLAAEAQALLAKLPLKFTEAEAEALGWRVVPDAD